MTDRTTTFTIRSTDVSSDGTSDREIVSNVQTPNIETNTTNVNITSDKDNILLEVDLAGLGEHRQPDNTRIIYQPDIFSISDHQTYLVDKGVFDSGSAKDGIQNFVIDSDKFDEVQSVEFFEIDFNKPFTDIFTTPDFVEQEVGKVSFDTSSVDDENTKIIEPDKFDAVNSPERVEKVLFKSIFDAIGVTDDFYGTADPDDDQTAHVRDVNFDTSGVSDFSYRTIFKAISDTVNTVEDFEANDGTIKDIGSIVDIFAASLIKVAEDTTTNSEYKEFYTELGKLDTAVTNDILSTVITFFRDYVDTAAAADSGRLNLHDYVAEEYMLEDYTGVNTYF